MASVSRDEWLAAARSWLGVPWVHQGRNRWGVDCIGLVICVARDLGLTDYDVRGYGRSPMGDFMRRECDRLMSPVREAEPGDVMILRFSSMPQHVLIRSDRGVIHAWAPARRVVEVEYPRAWRSRVVASYRVPGVV